MARLDQDRQKKLEPIRMNEAIKQISELGFEVFKENESEISFEFQGSKIKYFAYSGWHSGKTIKDGRGLKNLLNQLKDAKCQ